MLQSAPTSPAGAVPYPGDQSDEIRLTKADDNSGAGYNGRLVVDLVPADVEIFQIKTMIEDLKVVSVLILT